MFYYDDLNRVYGESNSGYQGYYTETTSKNPNGKETSCGDQ